MKIPEVKVRKTFDNSRLKALVSITLDDEFAVHDIKIIEGPQRTFVAMPSRKESDGTFRDIVHPISNTFRAALEEQILRAYEENL